jgi:nitrogen fixation/metabolism regulation signal transduction histidine kinase
MTDKTSETEVLTKSDPEPDNYGPFQTLDIAQMALEATNIGIWIIDTATMFFLPSPSTKELFGYTKGNKMSFDDAMSQIPEKQRHGVLATVESAFKNRTNFSVQFPVAGNGEKKQKWLSFIGGCGIKDEGAFYFSGIVMDITEQVHNDQRKSKFIGMVSHELKTPLTVLKAYIQMLNNWAKKQKDHFTIGTLSKVEKQVKKMLNMINGLLNLSGAEAGKIHLNKQDFSLNELIGEVIEETQFITSSDHIVFLPCGQITVHADREKIEQVIINLLNNASKYSEKNSGIEISCLQIKTKVQVNVKDNGIGISPDDIEKLFDPHYRVESKETQKVQGFGIGLYLCAEIIKRHKGKIWVESEPGKGSIFMFTLPLN